MIKCPYHVYHLYTYCCINYIAHHEAVMALHSIYKPLAPKKYQQLSE